jgi:hypothetical protein
LGNAALIARLCRRPLKAQPHKAILEKLIIAQIMKTFSISCGILDAIFRVHNSGSVLLNTPIYQTVGVRLLTAVSWDMMPVVWYM